MGFFDSFVAAVQAPIKATENFVANPNINTLGQAVLGAEKSNMLHAQFAAEATPNQADDKIVQDVSAATVDSKDVQNAAGWTGAALAAYYGAPYIAQAGSYAQTGAKYYGAYKALANAGNRPGAGGPAGGLTVNYSLGDLETAPSATKGYRPSGVDSSGPAGYTGSDTSALIVTAIAGLALYFAFN